MTHIFADLKYAHNTPSKTQWTFEIWIITVISQWNVCTCFVSIVTAFLICYPTLHIFVMSLHFCRSDPRSHLPLDLAVRCTPFIASDYKRREEEQPQQQQVRRQRGKGRKIAIV